MSTQEKYSGVSSREIFFSSQLGNPKEILLLTVEYIGDIEEELARLGFARALPISDFSAIVFVEAGRVQELIRLSETIQYVDPLAPYTLTQISPIEAANILEFSQGGTLDLRGTGVVVGIIDTGIDYLNREFMTEDERTRIDRIWDQTIEGGRAPFNIGYGSEYTREDINRAIETQKSGGDPYSIVPSKDDNGHGTANAGIIGARGYSDMVGAAPDCEFIVVKLRETTSPYLQNLGIYDEPGVYRSSDIITAMYYLTEVQRSLLKPMVVFIPLGSNFGGHDGSSAIERLIDLLSIRRGLVFVTGTGNQGNTETHTAGVIARTGDTAIIEIDVDPNQRGLALNIWCSYPERISIGVTSPTGEVMERIPARLNGRGRKTFLYEKTVVNVIYYFPENTTGDELILVIFNDLKPGIWRIILYGDYIVNGKYDIWMPQRPIAKPGTRFLSPTNAMTLTIPSTSGSVIATGYYDQSNNVLGPSSGIGYTRDNRIKPDLVSGGVEVLTTAVGGGTTIVTGSSAAAAVLSGAVALLLQWGIVNGNDPKMYGEEIRNYLIRGTRKRPGDVYPNPEWGFGMLDLAGAFDAIAGQENTNLARLKHYEKEKIHLNGRVNGEEIFQGQQEKEIKESYTNVLSSQIYKRIPRELYNRLKPSRF
ncbi:S8 family peptidase [Clostridium sp. UBA4548]|uniref:S8 family peptidase n=1 Tax=Clostridium sp. UBA4548 TaxID=1946361 RepID=UPI0025BFF7F5|nr:S8 family peptidase [Clostridium sp. UBA4548]